ncbi:MAG: GtrA family protein [Prevotellaceae bacterium]|jgi:putative flippase GtrA|nr:GtrA family protein [Prevotellaceae bacterium]
MSKLKKIYGSFANRGGIFLFLRSQLSSQMATLVDNSIALLLKKTLDIFKIKVIYLFSNGIKSYVFATVTGQICGGLFSCFMNYRWAFKTKDIKFRYILVKFFFVWLISVSLNTCFTFLLTERIKEMPWLIKLFGQVNSDDIFIVIKLVVAVIVGFSWNYLMYKHFVFKNISFKKKIIE